MEAPKVEDTLKIQSKHSGGLSLKSVFVSLVLLLALTAGGLYFSGVITSQEDAKNAINKLLASINTGTSSSVNSSSKPATQKEEAAPPGKPYSSAEAYGKIFKGLFSTVKSVAPMVAPPSFGKSEGDFNAPIQMPEDGSIAQKDNFNPPSEEALNPPPSEDSVNAPSEDSIKGSDSSGSTENSDQGSSTSTLSSFIFFGNSSLGLGESVITDVQKMSDSGFVTDQDQFNRVAAAEMAKAKLSKAELTLLSQTNIGKDQITDSEREAVQKFIRLFYYAKKLGKSESLGVLLEAVHPSIREAVNENDTLKIETSAPENIQAPNQDSTAAIQNSAKLEQEKPAIQAPLPPSHQVPDEIEPPTQKLNDIKPSTTTDTQVLDFASQYEEGRRAANSGNFNKALQAWRPIAEAGFAKAQTSIGRMYARGDGVKKNFTEAFKWFQRAADQDDELAEVNLGKLYYFGDGVQKDLSEAKVYFRKAAQHGNSEALKYLDELGGR